MKPIELFYKFLVERGALFAFLQAMTPKSLEEIMVMYAPKYYIWNSIRSYSLTVQGWDYWNDLDNAWVELLLKE